MNAPVPEGLPVVAPWWGRLLILPAIIAFVGLGLWLLNLGVKGASMESGGVVVLVIMSAQAAFMFYISWRGAELLRHQNVRASVRQERLWIQRGKHRPVESYALCDLSVRNHSFMQIVRILEKESNRVLLAGDYFYPAVREISREVCRAGRPWD